MTVTSPAGVTVFALGSGNFSTGNCYVSLTAATNSAITCPDGLPAGSMVDVNFSSPEPSITATVTYNANQTTSSGMAGPSSQVINFQNPSLSAPTPAPTIAPSLPAPTLGPTVTYQAGWNLVAGPAGTVLTGAAGSLYTYQANDSSYEVLPVSTALTAGVGYWAYFPSTTMVTQAASSVQTANAAGAVPHASAGCSPSGNSLTLSVGQSCSFSFSASQGSWRLFRYYPYYRQ